MTVISRPSKDHKYKWIRVRDARIPATGWQANPGANDDGWRKLFAVGILADGTLHNPNGYPEDIVRAAVENSIAERHAERSAAAKKAGETRRIRQARRVYAVAKKLAFDSGAPLGPRGSCVICGRGLGDQQSIDRGIGSECWQDVLSAIAAVPR